ncbi:uncharacterized protein AB675_720 [Cyphellophora attinorum]|uniref:Uncharacterized protein n=1 Tax=Cyphellophora attinorum TaxID=1664694 RepID=A0A0N1HY80_9EURO|nr:uncharacterized protein AB675_720 [Phialophora attinorum]KPI45743.1 hypothetical protein AB675_720 [Phialophora attinorum]
MRAIVHEALTRGFPSVEANSENPSVVATMQQIVTRRSAFEALMYSQFVRDVYYGNNLLCTRRQGRLRLEYHVRVIESVRHGLINSQDECGDETITMVLSLALQEQVGVVEDQTKKQGGLRAPKQGPLQLLRMLDVYGAQRIADTTPHITALLKMAEIRGGVAGLGTGGLGHQISNIELIEASRDLRRPCVEFVTFLDRSDILLSLQSYQPVDHRLASLARGFSALDQFDNVDLGDRSNLRELLHQLALYTCGVDSFLLDGKPQNRALAYLGEQRNLVHHNLLMALPETNLATSSWRSNDRAVHAVLHLAAVIYSFLCVFPMDAAPFGLLQQHIWHLLQCRDLTVEWANTPELYIWTLFMAAIASPDPIGRNKAIRLLRPTILSLHITSWEALKEKLMDFLWMPVTNDEDGKSIWNELHEAPTDLS